MIKNLQTLVAELEAAGELKRIKTAVDPAFEITEITDRVSKAGGPALLFENVSESAYPLLINAFGSYRRMQMILNCHSFDDIGARIEAYLKTKPPGNIKEKIRTLFTLKELAGIFPKKSAMPPVRRWCMKPAAGCWTFCRYSPAGPKTVAPLSPCRWSSPRIRKQAPRTWVCTACTSTTGAPRECTGSTTRTAPGTLKNTGSKTAAWR